MLNQIGIVSQKYMHIQFIYHVIHKNYFYFKFTENGISRTKINAFLDNYCNIPLNLSIFHEDAYKQYENEYKEYSNCPMTMEPKEATAIAKIV